MELKQKDFIEQEIPSGCPMAKIDSEKVDSISNNILRFLRRKLKGKYGDKKPSRIFHKKTIGLVEAELKIKEGLDDSLKQGLFKEETSYKAWIRFTNGNPNDKPDNKKAARGMAIKILGLEKFKLGDDKDPEGYTQDIILFNHPTFTPGLAELQKAGVKVVTGNALEFITGAIAILLRQFKAGIEFIRFARIRTPNVLEEIYYSATPYSFGADKAIKWQAVPLKTITSVLPKNPSRNYLRENLKRDLSDPKEDISFALRVQFCKDARTEPINDSTVKWNTEFHHVGSIILPKQNIDTQERKRKSSELFFSPGHCIRDHAPLGVVNMVRRKVYTVLAKERLAFLKDKP